MADGLSRTRTKVAVRPDQLFPPDDTNHLLMSRVGAPQDSNKWNNVAKWSIATPASRQRCAPGFITQSFLLLRSPADGVMQVDSLRICPPCKFFCTRVLQPVFTAANLNTVQAEVRNYVQALMNARGGGSNFLQVYSGQFFSAALLRPLLNNHSWEMSPGFDPIINDKLSFNIYSFLKCLRGYETHPTLLPSAGLDILLSKCLVTFVYMWFRGMDVEAGL